MSSQSDKNNNQPWSHLEDQPLVGNRYQLISQLNEGGMGTLYLVEDTRLKRRLALKKSKTGRICENEWKRLELEARAAAQLSHPNIVTVLDLGLDQDGQPYFVMELLNGQSLSQILKNKKLPVEDVLDIFEQIAAGLGEAHSRGIVHRDIKPGNIMLIDNAGKTLVKIVDFGLAKLTATVKEESLHLTASGEVMGSPLYMSPEQCRGEKVDQRSDIYSFGCMLFEALTGRPPFKGSDALSTMYKHINESPPQLSDDLEGLDKRLVRLVQALLEKEPQDRLADCNEIISRLHEIRNSQPDDQSWSQDSDTVPTRGGRPFPFSLLVTIAVVVAAFAAPFVIGHLLSFSPASKPDQPSPYAPTEKPIDSSEAFFSQIEGDQRTFAFPSSSIGEIGPDSFFSHREKKQDARGLVKFDKAEALEFTPNDTFCKTPALFDKFHPDDLVSVNLAHKMFVDDDALLALEHLTGLRALTLNCTDISNESIKTFNKLPNLKHLDIGFTRITGNGLTKLKRFNDLTHLTLGELRGPRALLNMVAGSNLERIEFQGTDLSQEDLINLGRAPHLIDISMRFARVNDAQVNQLAGAKELRILNLDDNPKLTPAIIPLFRNFSHLQYLAIKAGPELWSEADIARLKESVPSSCRLEITGRQTNNAKVEAARDILLAPTTP